MLLRVDPEPSPGEKGWLEAPGPLGNGLSKSLLFLCREQLLSVCTGPANMPACPGCRVWAGLGLRERGQRGLVPGLGLWPHGTLLLSAPDSSYWAAAPRSRAGTPLLLLYGLVPEDQLNAGAAHLRGVKMLLRGNYLEFCNFCFLSVLFFPHPDLKK